MQKFSWEKTFFLENGGKSYGATYDSITMKSYNWQKLMALLPHIKKEFDLLKQMEALPAADNPEQVACLEACNTLAGKLFDQGKKI